MAMNLQKLRTTLEPALRRIFHLYWRFARGMTPVSYTHITLPTSGLVEISVVAVSLKKNKKIKTNSQQQLLTYQSHMRHRTDAGVEHVR